MRRPVIAVTGPDRGGAALWLFLWLSVRLAGGRPRRVLPSSHGEDPEFDGLILSGGADLDPGLYGQEPAKLYATVKGGTRSLPMRVAGLVLLPLALTLRQLLSRKRLPGLDHARDRLGTRLALSALGRGLPVLGICRGAQLINVLRGGTLFQDLSGFYTETPALVTILPRKPVSLTPGSLLARLTGRRELVVNALHHQAIHRTGEGLRVTATEASGVIQAVEPAEDAGAGFLLGVQWHPELLPHMASQRALFRGLVDAAAKRAER